MLPYNMHPEYSSLRGHWREANLHYMPQTIILLHHFENGMPSSKIILHIKDSDNFVSMIAFMLYPRDFLVKSETLLKY